MSSQSGYSISHAFSDINDISDKSDKIEPSVSQSASQAKSEQDTCSLPASN